MPMRTLGLSRSPVCQEAFELAVQQGLMHYQGSVCKYGHNGIRYVSSHNCLECMKRRKPSPRHPLWAIWCGMRQRCYDTNHPAYKDYGGRGINVCERWRRSFADFIANMGERPPGYTLDRIDNDGDYEPDNVRWATRTDQARNSRRCKVSLEQVCEIRKLQVGGWSSKELSQCFGLPCRQVWRIVMHKTWKD